MTVRGELEAGRQSVLSEGWVEGSRPNKVSLTICHVNLSSCVPHTYTHIPSPVGFIWSPAGRELVVLSLSQHGMFIRMKAMLRV